MVGTPSNKRGHDDNLTQDHSNKINTNDSVTVGKENGGVTTCVSGYEQSREQRIKDNKEKMQKLGIFDLSLKLKPRIVKKTGRINGSSEKKSQNPLPDSAPARRSSRLETIKPVNYAEKPTQKKRESSGNAEIVLKEGSKPEIYTEEHEKLLGHSKTSWNLFVDGYGEDGKRIYDPVKGETCHQCRQKTLGHHAHCSKCTLVQGQFCGDCLYMRYGENVIEVNQNPEWICPVCRGICNCSLCRKAKGWAPTGALYKKVVRLGFKSVAHYLIQTLRTPTGESGVKLLGAESFDSEGKGSQLSLQLESHSAADEDSDGFQKPQAAKVDREMDDEMEVPCLDSKNNVGSEEENNDNPSGNDDVLQQKEGGHRSDE
ncbi:hypothetical protein HS088_TW07G01250 [Tripterygium wilfordii]|uniref:Zinc-finger domain-containing protein n=1 Tax=Tripterygium wilfordii TaxID=458696 RepID=A0A7J7DH89_TRIWF|nr:cell division cycle-associated protein 7-like [Tripterygium wilfordii]KAF5745658.1 hypothetical protein HS088_TW07G01250 [Tripterygium wilfordii]